MGSGAQSGAAKAPESISVQIPTSMLNLLQTMTMLQNLYSQVAGFEVVSKPETLLMSLIKKTGPIKTFFINSDTPRNATHLLAAYTELKIIIPPGRKTERLVNRQIKGVEIEYSWRKQAYDAAIKDGRVPCYKLGQLDERTAVQTLVNIASRSELRAKHRPHLIRAIKHCREYYRNKRYAWPDPRQPDTLGWRIWHWDFIRKKLISPSQGTIWDKPELTVLRWDTNDAVRGFAGIHAALMPYNWRKAKLSDHAELSSFASGSLPVVHGIVERFGKYVLGTEGWRAERVFIRALKAPGTAIGLAIEAAYPQLEGKVYYEDR